MFWNKKKNDEPQQDSAWGPLLAKYPPAKEMTKPSEHIIGACRNAGVPEELLAFMQKYGFGNFGNGILKTIDPEDYFDSLFTWLGGEDYSKIPFMMTGFGDLFYYRKLEGGEYDISLLDIHYRSVSVPAWTVADFIKFLLDPETEEKLLRGKLFQQAVAGKGALAPDEIFFFVPALVIGGAEDMRHISKGNARVHQHVLFQVGYGQ